MAASSFLEERKMVKVLGLGKFGIVFEAKTPENGDISAIRAFFPREQLSTELSLSQLCNLLGKWNENVVSLFSFKSLHWTAQDLNALQDITNGLKSYRVSDYLAGLMSLVNSEKSMLGVVLETEFCGVSLETWLKTTQGSKTASNDTEVEDMQVGIVLGLVKGLQFLHSEQIIHGNLSPKYVLFSNQLAQLPIKIGNYGFPQYRLSDETVIGVNCLLYSPRVPVHSVKSDLFSLGLIIWEVLSLMEVKDRASFFDCLVVDGKIELVKEHPRFENAKEVIVNLTQRKAVNRPETVADIKLELKKDTHLMTSSLASNYESLEVNQASHGSGGITNRGILNILKSLHGYANRERSAMTAACENELEIANPWSDRCYLRPGICLGNGSFGVIYSAGYKSNTMEIKTVVFLSVTKHEMERLLNGVKMQALLLRHEDILKLLYYDFDYAHKKEKLVSLELSKCGNRQQYLRARNIASIENTSVDLLEWNMLTSTGLNFLFDKESQILQSDFVPGQLDGIKIGDFDLSGRQTDDTQLELEEARPMKFILQHGQYPEMTDGARSSGIVFWEASTSEESCGRRHIEKVIQQFHDELRLWEPLRGLDEMYSTMKDCQAMDPIKWPTFIQIQFQRIKKLNPEKIPPPVKPARTTTAANYDGISSGTQL